ncbi:MAG: SLOG family protein [Huintestinicola sp.]
MDIIREKTVCFTGHRPEKLPSGGADGSGEVKVIKSMLYNEISSAADDGFDTFITGMQRGIDLWAGEIVLELAAARRLRLIAALPYRDFGKGFKGTDKWNFGRITDSAEMVVIMSETYTPACMKLRNQYMVDNSSRLIAVIGNERSGTGQTVRYAAGQGLDIRRIDLNELFSDKAGLTLL